LDTDNDGKISATELKKGFTIGHYSVDDESIKSILKQCDKNGDGKIDFN
jgi:Ca2+-binding EF-hand superfamily protein